MISVYKLFFSHRPLRRSTLLALLMLIWSLFINFYAWSYAEESKSNSVTDIILSNTQAYDVDWFFINGMIVFSCFIILWCLRYPHHAPYIIKSIATFIIIRSVFISLTHIWPFPNSIQIDNNGTLGKFNFGADLFFSGHTGLPFLMALIFWDHKLLRYVFLISSLFFWIIVLLWHLHYSIDVLAAFFITYAIHHICEYIWLQDKKYFQAYNSLIYPHK